MTICRSLVQPSAPALGARFTSLPLLRVLQRRACQGPVSVDPQRRHTSSTHKPWTQTHNLHREKTKRVGQRWFGRSSFLLHRRKTVLFYLPPVYYFIRHHLWGVVWSMFLHSPRAGDFHQGHAELNLRPPLYPSSLELLSWVLPLLLLIALSLPLIIILLIITTADDKKSNLLRLICWKNHYNVIVLKHKAAQQSQNDRCTIKEKR